MLLTGGPWFTFGVTLVPVARRLHIALVSRLLRLVPLFTVRASVLLGVLTALHTDNPPLRPTGAAAFLTRTESRACPVCGPVDVPLGSAKCRAGHQLDPKAIDQADEPPPPRSPAS